MCVFVCLNAPSELFQVNNYDANAVSIVCVWRGDLLLGWYILSI